MLRRKSGYSIVKELLLSTMWWHIFLSTMSWHLTISDYFAQAQLSQAAYSEGLQKDMFGGGTSEKPSDYANLLIDGGMSKSQAIDFANTYTVVEQYTDPISGFSGTVFKGLNENGVQQTYMAIRGTEPTAFSTDWPENRIKGTLVLNELVWKMFLCRRYMQQ